MADENDGVDNNGDGVVDESGEQIIMSKFVYYNNIQGTPDGNPNIAQDFYNYLSGRWLDGFDMTYGGNGRDQNNPACNYMFPGDTDPAFPGQTWTEQTAGNENGDRRFLQSAGKFTLAPGAVNNITTGVVWSRASEGGAFASVEKLKADDDIVQNIFDNCFNALHNDYSDLEIKKVNSNKLKNLIKTINILVQEVSVNYLNTGTPYIEIYDDGSAVKKIKTD